MANTCTICRHPRRAEIDRALVERIPFRRIAAQFGASASALIRHFDDHLPELLSKAKAAEQAAQADDLLAQVRRLQTKAESFIERAEGMGDFNTALRGIKEARDCIRLLGELAGKLQAQATVNIVLSPEWRTLQAIVIAALGPHLEAKLAVVDALGRLESPHVAGHA